MLQIHLVVLDEEGRALLDLTGHGHVEAIMGATQQVTVNVHGDSDMLDPTDLLNYHRRILAQLPPEVANKLANWPGKIGTAMVTPLEDGKVPMQPTAPDPQVGDWFKLTNGRKGVVANRYWWSGNRAMPMFDWEERTEDAGKWCRSLTCIPLYRLKDELKAAGAVPIIGHDAYLLAQTRDKAMAILSASTAEQAGAKAAEQHGGPLAKLMEAAKRVKKSHDGFLLPAFLNNARDTVLTHEQVIEHRDANKALADAIVAFEDERNPEDVRLRYFQRHAREMLEDVVPGQVAAPLTLPELRRCVEKIKAVHERLCAMIGCALARSPNAKEYAAELLGGSDPRKDRGAYNLKMFAGFFNGLDLSQ